MDAGVKEVDYWDMTYGEIVNIIKSHNRIYEREQREKALFFYKLADLITAGVASLFSEDLDFPHIYQSFPGMFEPERVLIQKAEQQKQMEIYKARFTAFALSHNEKRGGRINDA